MKGASGRCTRSGSSTLPPKRSSKPSKARTETPRRIDPEVAAHILSLLTPPSNATPRYTEADVKPLFVIYTDLRMSKTLALSTNRRLRSSLPVPVVPQFILELGTGMVIGNLKYRRRITGSQVDCSSPGIVHMIPYDVTLVDDFKSEDALFILLVGNDYAFHELSDQCFCSRFPCIIVSAQGPPDFLVKLKTDLNLPVLALFDCDPNGLKMVCFYRRLFKNDIKWLGIRPTDFDKYGIKGEGLTSPMTDKDIKTATDLLKDPCVKRNPRWLHELEVILKCERKSDFDSFFYFTGANYLTQVFLPMKHMDHLLCRIIEQSHESDDEATSSAIS